MLAALCKSADHLKLVYLCHPLLRDHANNMALLASEILNAALQIGGCGDLHSLYTTMIQLARQVNRASAGCLRWSSAMLERTSGHVEGWQLLPGQGGGLLLRGRAQHMQRGKVV